MTLSPPDDEEQGPSHILSELGFVTSVDGQGVHGEATVFPAMWVPGTRAVRTSILATWADTVAGLTAMAAISPRVPVTLELDVHLFEVASDRRVIRARAAIEKAGRSVVVLSIEVTGDGQPLALAHASFMASPDRTLTMPFPAGASPSSLPRPRLLDVPLAERAGVHRRAPGVSLLPHSKETINASQTLNGGLLALAAEDAVLSLSPPSTTLSSMALRYLRPVRTGPAVATATLRGGLARVEVRDEGHQDRLAVLATARTFEPDRRGPR